MKTYKLQVTKQEFKKPVPSNEIHGARFWLARYAICNLSIIQFDSKYISMTLYLHSQIKVQQHCSLI